MRRAGVDRRLGKLERRVVRCVACASASNRFFRVLPDDEYEEVVRTGVLRNVCPACGAEWHNHVKVYRESDIAGI